MLSFFKDQVTRILRYQLIRKLVESVKFSEVVELARSRLKAAPTKEFLSSDLLGTPKPCGGGG